MRGRIRSAQRTAVGVGLVMLITAAGAINTPATPAHALTVTTGDQKLAQNTLYSVVEGPVTDPTGKCSVLPGVHRTSKVWNTVYGSIDQSGKTTAYAKVRMNFTTDYSPAVAAAEVAYKQVGMNGLPCELYASFDGKGVVATDQAIACASWYSQRPNRWCSVAATNPGDPALNMQLQQECSVKPGGPYPVIWNEWHNLGGYLFTYDIINQTILDISGGLTKAIGGTINAPGGGDVLSTMLQAVPPNMPVYLDDVTVLGGVSNFDRSTGQPANGASTWLGYGHIQSPLLGEFNEKWYDSAATRLGQDPVNYPTKAHNYVDDKIAAHQADPTKVAAPVGSFDGTNWITHKQWTDIACAYSYGMRDLLDPFTAASAAGFGQDLQGLTTKLTNGQNFCARQILNGRAALAIGGGCNNVWLGALFPSIDNGNLMDPAHSDIAAKLGVDLGTGRDQHMRRLARRYWELIA